MLKFCKRCVMDGSAPGFRQTETGCNFCDQAEKSFSKIKYEKLYWVERFNELRSEGKYDCLVGLSGGVDSSTVLHYIVSFGLRPLCFTMDNGYNDPKADENILRLVEALNVPLYRYVLDLDKYRELQSSYLKAGVINVEASYDHLLMAATYEMASKYGIKWIVSGGNVATESIMPSPWSYPARDLTNLKSIYRWATGKKLRGLPICGLLKWNYYRWIKGIKIFYPLDFLDYNRKESEKMLIEKYGFQSTGEKHEENIFTRWYQSFYLFEKFGIDKRKPHFSSLIMSGQMTRKEAMDLLAERPVYPELGIERRVMNYPKRSHYDFKTDEKIWLFVGTIVRALRRLLTK